MADIKTAHSPLPDEAAPAAAASEEDVRLIEAMELLFFAYRDFVGDPDAILATKGFGRAHHRVLHFVGRNPGITVQNLLGILRITKQSLARVLRQLIDAGQVVQHRGTQDRRQRHLYLTLQGQALWAALQAPQKIRLARAFATAGPAAEAGWRAVMDAMLDRASRAELHRHAALPDHIGHATQGEPDE